MPRVSVVLPARNEALTIGRSVASLRRQTFSDWELIVIDDGSTDATVEVVNSIADDRIRVVSTGGRGLAHALNAGLSSARGLLIARQDADDESLPGRFQAQVEFLERNPDVGVLGTAWREEDARGNQVRPRVPFVPGLLNDRLHDRNPITHTTVMFRRDVVLRHGGYDERYRYVEDYELWLRLAAGGVLLWNLPEVLAIRRMTGGNIAARHEQAQVLAEVRLRLTDVSRRATSGRPFRGPVRRLLPRIVVLVLPTTLKRLKRRLLRQA
jgi:glycosyltransferase involved in cell wall biosynthesis